MNFIIPFVGCPTPGNRLTSSLDIGHPRDDGVIMSRMGVNDSFLDLIYEI